MVNPINDTQIKDNAEIILKSNTPLPSAENMVNIPKTNIVPNYVPLAKSDSVQTFKNPVDIMNPRAFGAVFMDLSD